MGAAAWLGKPEQRSRIQADGYGTDGETDRCRYRRKNQPDSGSEYAVCCVKRRRSAENGERMEQPRTCNGYRIQQLYRYGRRK